MKTIVALSGAGISAESGIKTFRESGGLWEDHDVMDVASPEGWHKNKELVLRFYNERRKQLSGAKPNNGHIILAELEKHFNVKVVTQNVDNLHEQAGSSDILHLHGELTKVRSTLDPTLIYDIGYKEIKIGDTCEKGAQLRPHIVWFGEAVPAFEEAIKIAEKADIFIVVGTSLNVYPAASLLHYKRPDTPVFIIDPNQVSGNTDNATVIKEPATTGMKTLKDILLNEYL